MSLATAFRVWDSFWDPYCKFVAILYGSTPTIISLRPVSRDSPGPGGLTGIQCKVLCPYLSWADVDRNDLRSRTVGFFLFPPAREQFSFLPSSCIKSLFENVLARWENMEISRGCSRIV